ncbi:TetR/AcrR family transcriptional regulator [Solihabitans fulvus]|uniref:TetR/AcrR family transcriptional regulator n=1 Tax=Solihabitans fulvus TaxID=1892852 RepID=UPI0016620FBF|nr:TetR/AcrR family transcriptional regulator [Solihabitans fulvus]
MSPRAYQSDKRQAAAEETRERILGAARRILAGKGVVQVTIDSVAREADVSRQTVYNAFGSKSGLLEALCDALANRGRLDRLAGAMTQGSPDAALAGFVEVFCRFWAADRVVTRRLRGLAVADRDLDRVLRERDERRRHGLRALLRLFPELVDGSAEPQDDLVDLLWTLTSFETFDVLATKTRGVAAVAALLTDAAGAVLGLPGQRH